MRRLLKVESSDQVFNELYRDKACQKNYLFKLNLRLLNVERV